MIDRGANVRGEMAFAWNVLFSPVLPPSHLYGGKCKCNSERLKRNTIYFMTFYQKRVAVRLKKAGRRMDSGVFGSEEGSNLRHQLLMGGWGGASNANVIQIYGRRRATAARPADAQILLMSLTCTQAKTLEEEEKKKKKENRQN